MKLKPGVSLRGIKPEIAIACIIIDGIARKYNYEFVLTAGTDSEHSAGSLHYVGLALDKRLPSTMDIDLSDKVIAELKIALGEDKENKILSEFDVIYEGDHIHCEFQPKDRR